MSRSKKQQWGVFFFALYGVATLTSMAVMSLGLLSLLASAYFLFQSNAEFKRNASALLASRYPSLILKLSVALTLAISASTLGGLFFPATVGGVQVRVEPVRDLLKTWYLFLPLVLLLIGSALPKNGLAYVLKAWLVASGILSAVGIFEHYFGWPHYQVIPNDPTRFHATVFLGHHLSLASIWIFPVFVSLALLFSGRSLELAHLSRRAVFSIALLGLICLTFTYSRMLWMALIAGLAAFFISSVPPRMKGGALLILLTTVIGAYQIPQIKVRFHAVMGMQDRFDLWEANRYFFELRPLTGVGFKRSSDLSGPYLKEKYPGRKDVFAGHAHNVVLEMLASTGILGCLAWLSWCFGAVWIVWSQRKSEIGRVLAGGLLSAWLVFHLNGLTQVNFWEGKVLHQVMWVTGLSLLLFGKRREEVTD